MEEITSTEFYETIKPVYSFNTVKSLFSRVEFEDTVKLINSIPDLEKLALKKYNNKTHTLLWAVQCNFLHVVKWICEHNFETPTQFILELASKRGHFDIFVWLMHNTEVICTQRVLDIAAFNGQVKIVKWIYQHSSIQATHETLNCVYNQGFYSLAEWLKEHTPVLNNYIKIESTYDLYNYMKKNIQYLYK